LDVRDETTDNCPSLPPSPGVMSLCLIQTLDPKSLEWLPNSEWRRRRKGGKEGGEGGLGFVRRFDWRWVGSERGKEEGREGGREGGDYVGRMNLISSHRFIKYLFSSFLLPSLPPSLPPSLLPSLPSPQGTNGSGICLSVAVGREEPSILTDCRLRPFTGKEEGREGGWGQREGRKGGREGRRRGAKSLRYC